MATFEESTPETERGRAIFAELLWVHSAIRRDLGVVRRLAAETEEGRDAGELKAEIDALQTNGPLWQLKINCLRYCGFVHSHHNAEDHMFFPRLRVTNPEIGPVVDKLESDHRTVSGLLDAVEEAAQALGKEDADEWRARLSTGLDALADALLEHLDYEEENAGPTIRRLERL